MPQQKVKISQTSIWLLSVTDVASHVQPPPQMGRLAPTVKDTCQELGGKLWEILMVSAVTICKLLQLRPPTRAAPQNPTGGLLRYNPQK